MRFDQTRCCRFEQMEPRQMLAANGIALSQAPSTPSSSEASSLSGIHGRVLEPVAKNLTLSTETQPEDLFCSEGDPGESKVVKHSGEIDFAQLFVPPLNIGSSQRPSIQSTQVFVLPTTEIQPFQAPTLSLFVSASLPDPIYGGSSKKITHSVSEDDSPFDEVFAAFAKNIPSDQQSHHTQAQPIEDLFDDNGNDAADPDWGDQDSIAPFFALEPVIDHENFEGRSKPSPVKNIPNPWQPSVAQRPTTGN